MEGMLLLFHPWSQLFVKMMVVILLLSLLKRCQFSAAAQSKVWCMGLLVLLVLPWVNKNILLFELPVLSPASKWLTPTFSQTTEPADMLIIPTAEFGQSGVITPDAIQIWMLLALGVGVVLLFQIIRRVNKLHQITAEARQIDNPIWHRIAEQCVTQMTMHHLPVIKVTDAFNSPCTWGVFYPVVLIPDGIKDDQAFRMVLMHELAHIKRKDWCWMMLAQVVTALFWFNPLLWWVKSQLINSFETACDELVLQQNIQPSKYAETLLAFHQKEQLPITQVTTMMAKPSAMYLRLNHILNPQQRSQIMNSKKQNLLLLSASIATLLMTVSQLTSAHEVTVKAHPEAPPAVKSLPIEPPVVEPHPPMPISPAPRTVTQPPQPNAAPLPTKPVEPHVDGVVEPHPIQAPVAHPVKPHADHKHRIEDQSSAAAMKVKSRAMQKQLVAEERLQKQQIQLRQMAQQTALETAEYKQQLAKLEKQQRQLQVRHKEREVQMHERIESEKANAREKLRELKMAKSQLKQKKIEAERRLNQQ